jgi:hypothetical protein
MQVSAQLHVPAVLALQKKPSRLAELRLFGSNSVAEAREMINISGLCRKSNQDTSVAQPVA